MSNVKIIVISISLILILGIFFLVSGLEISFKESNTSDLEKEEMVQVETNDICLNLEGVQTKIPEGFLLDENNNCLSNNASSKEKEIVIQKEVVEVPVEVKTESVENNENEDGVGGIIDVSIATINDFDDEEGYYQYPLVVGYLFSNNTNKDVSVNKLYFTFDTFGGHYIKEGRTLHSVSSDFADKEDSYYFSDRDYLYVNLTEPFVIEPYSNKTLYLNIWNFLGDVHYQHQSKNQSTTVNLEEIYSNNPGIEFNVGPTSVLSTYIRHEK